MRNTGRVVLHIFKQCRWIYSLAVGVLSLKVAEAAAASGKGSVVTYFDHTKKQVMAQPASSLFAMNTEKVSVMVVVQRFC